MLRVCGAEMERDALSRSQCWCRGLFCGRGGFRLSTEFRKTFRTKVPARSRAELEDLMLQCDLFDGAQAREQWATKVDQFSKRRD